MASVVPAMGSGPSIKHATEQTSRTASWRAKGLQLLRLWQRMQVSYYGGKYSIHRVLALDEYIANTSLGRVLFTCLWTPLPMAALVFGQESIPLQEINDGWFENYGLWIRAAVLVCIVTYGILVQGIYLIDEFTVSTIQLLLLLGCVPAAVVGFSMVVAAHLVFPIPFFVLMVMPVYYLVLLFFLRIIVGSGAIRQMIDHSDQVARCFHFICAQTSIILIFPAYEMLFRAAEGTQYQLLVILLLPLIKVTAKNIVLYFAKSLEDMIPVEVIFTADFFNAVYVATCMQRASSVTTVVAITVTDFSQTIVMMYGLQRRTTNILSRLRHTVSITRSRGNMLAMICWLCRNPEQFEKQAHAGIRRHSCLPHQISEVNKRALDRLSHILVEPSLNDGSPRVSFLPKLAFAKISKKQYCLRSISPRKHVKAIDSVVPGCTNSVCSQEVGKTQVSKSAKTLNASASNRSTVLLESLATIFTTECLIITAYLEALMPLFYCTYMLVMVNLQSAKYHTEMVGITRENVLATTLPLLVFGILQIASFFLLVVTINHNCGMHALYQLAFVLEKQRSLVQCKMALWMVITLCFRVEHFGVDFKFAFIRLGFPRSWTPHG